MFKKPFRTKSKTLMKGSDRKKLRAEITKTFNGLSVKDAAEIIPSKEEVTIDKIYTNAGDTAFIYCVNKTPVFFEIDKQKVLYPTVYLLWKYPDIIPCFTTWPPVFNKMMDGADLMLPGLVVRGEITPRTFTHVKGQTCSVNLVGNRSPIVVGCTLLSGSDFYDSGMKGKGIHALHLFGDELWALGDKSNPPHIEDEPVDTCDDVDDEDDNEAHIAGEEGGANLTEGVVTNKGGDIRLEGGACGEELPNMEDIHLNGNNVENGDSGECVQSQSLHDDNPISPGEMDDLVEFCFLCALKASVKKGDLPLVTGTFYKVHMMKFCPADQHLDIKKSTYKKLSKFLQKQEKTGIIKMKELSKGVDSIVEMDRSHLRLRGFEAGEPTVVETESSTDNVYVPPQITEMLAVTSNVLPLYKQLGYRKGSAMKTGDIRDAIKQYVTTNNLQDENNKSHVILDPILAEILLTKAEGDQSTLTWEEIFSRLQSKMSPVFEIVLPGQQPIIRKGNIEPIRIEVVQRAANKKATVIENLDVYGIDAREFAHHVQVKVACSASVNPSPQKNKGPLVTIQGNQTNFVEVLLTNTYKVARKYIKGLDKGPKSKHR